ncbi:mitochondrial substrate carrier family protein ucpB isoform X1 [Selaginella moellendorffii]|uniref:mitochondrial substrate carrier family protein ucpB isoform X1 n=1 Tax=Selaginella moellendorffii TaxID=88036 RepID=UPI000D1CE2C5|nr:mitochondrial substrate carrier family protein ucpB isoform X1 [Selaginella moellendorffii]|eukprot:XP_002966666.2 mitochondrial substrate carrier family protein ucpB isoform X1 [Selaginella moellendorffii]
MQSAQDGGGIRLSPWIRESATMFALAGSSNMCGSAVTNPVNVVKVRMQLDGALSATQERHYQGLLKGIVRVSKEEGISGLWRGTGAALLREASYSSIRMGLYEPLKRMLGADNPSHTPLWIKITAGSLAGVIGSAVANPTDVVMVRMQAPTSSQGGWHYKGPLHAFSSIARTEGIQGLYRGVVPTMQRAAILNAVQVPAYDHTKHTLLNAGIVREGIVCHLISSMVAGLATAIAISPVDLIRTRIMQQAVDSKGDGVFYSSSLDCLWKTVKVEGFRGLYKGFVPVWMRIGPHTVITFFCFEQLRRVLGIKPL